MNQPIAGLKNKFRPVSDIRAKGPLQKSKGTTNHFRDGKGVSTQRAVMKKDTIHSRWTGQWKKMDLSILEYGAKSPHVVRRSGGDWLAVTPPESRLTVGVTASSEAEVREKFS
jgi:hypothetical protein